MQILTPIDSGDKHTSTVLTIGGGDVFLTEIVGK